jgi:hypothetical protein
MSVAFVLGISIATLVEVFRRDRIPQIGYALLAGSGAILGLIELQLRLENSAITPGLGSSLRMTIIDPLAAFSAALVLFGLFQGRFAVVARIASDPRLRFARIRDLLVPLSDSANSLRAAAGR